MQPANSLTHPWLDEGRRSSDTIPLAIAVLKEHGCKRVYDAGCGNGELMRRFSDTDFDAFVVGSDIEPGHIAIARSRTNWRVFVADACTFRPCPDGELDAVVALSWLHNDWKHKHATGIEKMPENPAYLTQALRTFHAILKPGGIFVWDFPPVAEMPPLLHELFRSVEKKSNINSDIYVATK